MGDGREWVRGGENCVCTFKPTTRRGSRIQGRGNGFCSPRLLPSFCSPRPQVTMDAHGTHEDLVSGDKMRMRADRKRTGASEVARVCRYAGGGVDEMTDDKSGSGQCREAGWWRQAITIYPKVITSALRATLSPALSCSPSGPLASGPPRSSGPRRSHDEDKGRGIPTHPGDGVVTLFVRRSVAARPAYLRQLLLSTNAPANLAITGVPGTPTRGIRPISRVSPAVHRAPF
jgi:hypothetical protein